MFNCTPLCADEQPLFPSGTKPPSSFNYVSPNSKLDPPSSFYHFSPTFTLEHNNHHGHDHDHGHFLPQQQQPVTVDNSLVTAGVVIDMAISNKKSRITNSDVNALHPNYNASMATSLKQSLNQKKRSVKRDRHSKIVTAQGIRDRRMRLSLDVAPDFFGLQDMRGDDKPSKTIRWLLNQCKGAIKEFSRAKELPRKQNCRNVTEKKTLANNESKRERRKTKFHHIGRESREKARARARERTIEKKRGRRSEYREEEWPQKRMYLSPSETAEKSEISRSHYQMKSSLAVVAEVEEPNLHLLEFQGPNQNTAGDHVVITSKSCASSIFSYQHDIAILQGLIASTSTSTSTTNENHIPSFFNWDIDGTRAYSS